MKNQPAPLRLPSARTREQLLNLFLMEEPHALSYQYRKKYSTYAADRAELEKMEKEGLIRLHQKTGKTITYVYVGSKPDKSPG